jgi:hypothetical protein
MNKTTRHDWATYTFIFAVALLLPHLSIAVASAATYYVATTGNNANSCPAATNTATPKRSIAAGIACMSAGDTLYIRGGTYAEFIRSVPSGSSYANAPVIAAYPGETVTLAPSGSNTDRVLDLAGSFHHVIFKDLRINAAGVGYGAWIDGEAGAHHIRLQGLEILNGGHNGVLLPAASRDTSTYIEFLSCNVHDNGGFLWGGQYGHGLYIGTSDNLVDGCQVHANGAYGIQIYSGGAGQPNRNTVRKNRIYGNKRLDPNGGGMTIGGNSNLIYNNLIYQNLGDGMYNIFGSPTNSKIMNNTVWNNAGDGIYNGGSGTLIANNIVYQNGGTQIVAGSATLQTNLSTNPNFLNAAVGDLRLQVGSPAINVGTTRAEVTVDMVGVSRPQGSAYDIGAYEFSIVDAIPPLPPVGLRVN